MRRWNSFVSKGANLTASAPLRKTQDNKQDRNRAGLPLGEKPGLNICGGKQLHSPSDPAGTLLLALTPLHLQIEEHTYQRFSVVDGTLLDHFENIGNFHQTKIYLFVFFRLGFT